ncbi:MAG: Undecaprenyl-diphosphatase [uncultured Thermomicrobiales bacterium]|uniref:Undecaprenyl-diphosphatase n=1 Tax=uncultured Thermomicrobiales bacterium TaxID=1645740 RepID=A0A6J4UHB5_9BACT|nr:MAG: Undecaprenyl-diphosphatase [uncultured Thermomicrobiales bacterium]
MPDWLIAIVLGIVEGLTEFIPVSSTGHLIVAGDLLGWDGPVSETFEVVIQLGAILAVAVVYRERFQSFLTLDGYIGRRGHRPGQGTRVGAGAGFRGLNGLILLACSALPAAILGFIFLDPINDYLFGPTTVAIGWIVGGIALVIVERFLPSANPSEAALTAAGPSGEPVRMPEEELPDGRRRALARPRYETLDDITWRVALMIGLWQCFALWPGASRSASTIVGGMFLGVSRKAAAEFSFFAAMPILVGASALSLWSSRDVIARSDVPIFMIGLVVAFISALVAVRWFVRFVSTRTMVPFGWYRIVAGSLLLGWLAIA